jgi:hypothetical protein
LLDKNIVGLESVTSLLEDKLYAYLKLFILLYADDNFIMAETDSDLQNVLNSFYLYCSQWKLIVMLAKPRFYFFFFSKGRIPKHTFYYKATVI